MLKVTWIGQLGLLFEKDDFKIMIDPYLSDSVEKIEPKNKRRVPIKKELFDIKPDVMIFTHNHLDHYDPETVKHFITKNSGITVLCPWSVYNEIKKFGGNNNYVVFSPHTSWTENNILFTSVKAFHSDPFAIGVIIDDMDKKYYLTGDTLYNSEIFEDIPNDIYAVFMPINAVGNNMNETDAFRFAKKVNAKYSIPLHFGMFDDIKPKLFDLIPKVYEKIDI